LYKVKLLPEKLAAIRVDIDPLDFISPEITDKLRKPRNQTLDITEAAEKMFAVSQINLCVFPDGNNSENYELE